LWPVDGFESIEAVFVGDFVTDQLEINAFYYIPLQDN